MLFGRVGKAEEIRLEEISKLVNSSFDSKLSSFGPRALTIAKDLERARGQFIDACKDLENVTEDPDSDFLYMENLNSIKIQKGFYSKALNHAANVWNTSIGDGENTYARYSTVLSNADGFAEEVLKTNAAFKKVMRSYPNHLGKFKSSFSLIEKLRQSLRSELRRHESEHLEYKKITNQLTKLIDTDAELKTVDKKIKDLANNSNPQNIQLSTAKGDQLLDEIANETKLLLELDHNISGLLYKINSLTLPLERASRKLDYLSSRKRQLSEFILDPINNLNSETDYKEFMGYIEELDKSIDSAKIDVKNPEKVKAAIHELTSSNIYSLTEELRERKKERHKIHEIIEVKKREVEAISGVKRAANKLDESIESMKNREEVLKSEIKKEKEKIEASTLEAYGKRISIIT